MIHAQAAEGVQVVSQKSRVLRTFGANRTAVVGMVLVIGIVFTAVAAPFIAPHHPLTQDVHNRLAGPSNEYLFGRDEFGRDILSRVIYGTRIALITGVASVFLGATVGTAMGMAAGFKGGRVELVIMRVVDVLLAFPELITGLLVLAVLGPGMWKMIVAIAITFVPRFARMAHAPTLAVKEQDFIDAARSIGVRDRRIMGVHILPNIVGELLVLASIWVGAAIRLEAAFSFVGLGVQPPVPTWGQMIRAGSSYLTHSAWYALVPGVAVLLTVLAFNLVGDGIRDVLDPRTQN